MSFLDDVLFFKKEYYRSIQAKVQNFQTNDPNEIFAKACYCLLTPATKAQYANIKCEKLLENDFIFNSSLSEIADLLRQAPEYIRFHNQKAERLVRWREKSQDIIDQILKNDFLDEKKLRSFLVENIYGMNLKETSHFLRNIGRGNSLAILDRHIIFFMKEEKMIPQSQDLTAARYEEWENIFSLWASSQGMETAQADYAVWAAGVKRRDSSLTYEYILQELE
ncbi:MAG: hypothetical protein ACRC9L_09720 [Brevinema sp.]